MDRTLYQSSCRGLYLAQGPAESRCDPAGDSGLEDASLDVALNLAEGGVINSGGGLREHGLIQGCHNSAKINIAPDMEDTHLRKDGEEGGPQAHVLHAVLAVAPVVAGGLLLPVEDK